MGDTSGAASCCRLLQDLYMYLPTYQERTAGPAWMAVYKPRNCSVPADGPPHIELVHPGSVHFTAVTDAATLQNPKSVLQLDNFEGVFQYYSTFKA